MDDDLKSDYDFDYSKSKLNRFAQKLKEQDRYIQLEPIVFKNKVTENIKAAEILGVIK